MTKTNDNHIRFTITFPRKMVEEAIANGSLRSADGSPLTYEQAVELLKKGDRVIRDPR